MRVADVIKSETTLDAKALLVGRTIRSLDVFDLIIFDFEGKLTTNAAIRTDRVHFTIIIGAVAAFRRIDHSRRHQRTSWARLHTLTAGHARRRTHRIIEVKYDLRIMTTTRHANDVVDLNFATRTDTEVAVNTGIEIDPHRDVRSV